MKRLLMLALCALPAFAQTGANASFVLCPPGAAGPLLSGFVNFGTLLVPTCFKIGAGLSFDVTTNTLSATGGGGSTSTGTTYVETLALDPNLPAAQTTITFTLGHAMDPKGMLVVLYKSSYAGLSAVDIKKPVGPNFQSVVVTLPLVRPFQAGDQIIFAYQSLQ